MYKMLLTNIAHDFPLTDKKIIYFNEKIECS